MPTYAPSGSGSVHVDKVLTNISLGWTNEGLVGERLFPSVPVQKQSDKYYLFGRQSWNVEPDDVRAPGSVANEIPGLFVSTDSYYAQEHSLQTAVTDEEVANADTPLSPYRDATENLTFKMALSKELRIRDLATNTANYATGMFTAYTDGATSGQWNNYADTTHDPITEIKTAIRAMHAASFLMPNTVIMSYNVMSYLSEHPAIMERVKYSQLGVLTPALIAEIFDIPNPVIAGAGYNAAAPGGAMDLGYIWSDDVILAYVPPRPGLKTPAFGYQFTWNYNNRMNTVERWREEHRKSDVTRLSSSYDLKLVGKDETEDKIIAGYVFKNVLNGV